MDYIKICKHNFKVINVNYSVCSICKEKKINCISPSLEIIEKVIGFDALVWIDETKEIDKIIKKYSLSFAKFYSHLKNDIDNFEKLKDDELIEMFEQYNKPIKRKRL